MAYDIFISYRREGGYETAKHLYDLLKNDGYNVSFDIDTLREGDFDIELLKRIEECTDFILVLNKGALDRCFTVDKSKDWLRQELAHALDHNLNIIPVMLAGFNEFPENLPKDIDRVRFKNGPKYDQHYFDAFYDKLKTFLRTTVEVEKRNLRKIRAEIDRIDRLVLEPFLCDGKYGYRDQDSDEIIVQPKYDEAHFFDTGLGLVKRNRKWGFMDKTGREVIPLKYDLARWFCEGFAAVELNGRWGFVDKYGEILIPFEWDFVGDFSEGFAAVELNGKWGFIDKNGNLLTELRYEGVLSFSEGLVGVKRNGKWGFINKIGRTTIPFEYDEVWAFTGDGYANVKLNGKELYINMKNERKYLPKEQLVENEKLSENKCWLLLLEPFKNANGKYGYKDRNSKQIIIQPIYDDVGVFYEDFAAVELNGRWGIIDKTGKAIVPLKYDSAKVCIDGGVEATLAGKTILFDDWGKKIISKNERLAIGTDINTTTSQSDANENCEKQDVATLMKNALKYEETEKYDEAIQCLKNFEETYFDDDETIKEDGHIQRSIWNDIAKNYEKQDNFNEAIKHYDISERYAYDGLFWQKLAETCCVKKKYDEAIKCLIKAGTIYNNGCGDEWVDMAHTDYFQDKSKELIYFYEKAIKDLFPNHMHPLEALAVFYYEQENDEKAIYYFKQILLINSNHTRANHKLFTLYEAIGDIQKAQEYLCGLMKALETEPDAFIYSSLGNYYFRKNKYDEALIMYRKAIEIKDYPKFYYRLGNVYYALKDYINAIDNYQRMINKTNEHQTGSDEYKNSWISMSDAYCDSGNPTQAIDCLTKFIEQCPNNIVTYNKLATIYEILGNTQKAQEYRLKMMELDKNVESD